MTYWCVEEERFCAAPIEGKRCLELSEERISALYEQCDPGRTMIVSGDDGYPEVRTIEVSERDLLLQERAVKMAWLRDHDYIGTKIATGRATIEDYADEIHTMCEYAERIEEIDLQLGGQNEKAD